MAIQLNKENIIGELKKQGTLSELLPLEQFAEPGKVADELAKDFKDKLKPTQLRKVFHALKEMERDFKGRKDDEKLRSEDKIKIYPLAPELAYARGRDLIPQDFYELMRLCLSSEKLDTIGDFRRLVQFLTAILAYHKYHEKGKGGK